jgi:hypothetical protein
MNSMSVDRLWRPCSKAATAPQRRAYAAGVPCAYNGWGHAVLTRRRARGSQHGRRCSKANTLRGGADSNRRLPCMPGKGGACLSYSAATSQVRRVFVLCRPVAVCVVVTKSFIEHHFSWRSVAATQAVTARGREALCSV